MKKNRARYFRHEYEKDGKQEAHRVGCQGGKDQERFDAKAFQTAHPDLYREFIKPVAASRRFLLK